MTAPRLFDRTLERQRRSRRPPRLPEVFQNRLIEDVLDRLALVKRPLSRMLLCGPFAPQIAPFLAAGNRDVFVEARDVEFDLETMPFAEASFDCALSLVGLETVNDLPGALIQFRRLLMPDGLFMACLFSGDTLRELRAAWLQAEEELRCGASPRVAPFADVRDLGALLQRAGFALPVTDVDRTTIRYPDALALMREIKALGLVAPLQERSRVPATPALLATAATSYQSQYGDSDGRIRATAEITWLTGWAPHESQQKPLKPGSAKARLADALKVEEKPLRRN